jgi:hypothetical protein
MIKRWLKRFLLALFEDDIVNLKIRIIDLELAEKKQALQIAGLNAGELRLRERIAYLERPKSYMAVDVGMKDPTTIVVMQKNTNGLQDKVEVYNMPKGVNFGEINSMVHQLVGKYGVEPNRLYVDQPVTAGLIKNSLKKDYR